MGVWSVPEWRCVGREPERYAFGRLLGVWRMEYRAYVTRQPDGSWNWRVPVVPGEEGPRFGNARTKAYAKGAALAVLYPPKGDQPS